MTSDDARRYELVNWVVGEEPVEAEAWSFARTVAQYSLATPETGKHTLHAQW